MTETPAPTFRLQDLLCAAGLPELEPDLAQRFERYLELLLRWNSRVNLTAIRDPQEIQSRHFVESIACARAVPAGVATLLDLGSGAGFPGIPIALCRPEIAVTLAESQAKKAAFLREALRTLGIEAVVHGGRAESLKTTFDCVVLRAVDRMRDAVAAGAALVAPHGWLMLMTTGAEVPSLRAAAKHGFHWGQSIRLAGSEDRMIALGQQGRTADPAHGDPPGSSQFA